MSSASSSPPTTTSDPAEQQYTEDPFNFGSDEMMMTDDDDCGDDVMTVCGGYCSDDDGSECSTPRTEAVFTNELFGVQDQLTPTPAITAITATTAQDEDSTQQDDDDDDDVFTDPDVGDGLHTNHQRQQEKTKRVPPPLHLSRLPLIQCSAVPTACHTSPRYIFIGYNNGVISMFADGGNVGTAIRTYTVGKGAVHTISTDASESSLVAADTLGGLLIQNLTKVGDNYTKKFSSPVTCVCMHPQYSLKGNGAILLGFKEGLVACVPGRIFGKRFTRIYNHGPVHAIAFRNNLVAFACGVDILMLDVMKNTIISKHTTAAPAACDGCRVVDVPCYLRWETDTTLFMGWGSHVARLIRARTFFRFTPLSGYPPHRYQIQGIELLPTRDCILVLIDIFGERPDNGAGVAEDAPAVVVRRIIHMLSFRNDIPQIVGVNAIPSSSILQAPHLSSMMSSHMLLNPTTGIGLIRKHYLLTPMGVYECNYSDTHLEECVQYLLTKRRIRQAFLFASVTGTKRPIPPGVIGCQLLRKQFARREWSQATEMAEKVCQSEGKGAEERLWGVVINTFDAMSCAYLLVDKMPTSHIRLPRELYNIVLTSCLHHDLPNFTSAVHALARKCDREALIQCTRAKLLSLVDAGGSSENGVGAVVTTTTTTTPTATPITTTTTGEGSEDEDAVTTTTTTAPTTAPTITTIGNILIWLYEEDGNKEASYLVRRLIPVEQEHQQQQPSTAT